MLQQSLSVLCRCVNWSTRASPLISSRKSDSANTDVSQCFSWKYSAYASNMYSPKIWDVLQNINKTDCNHSWILYDIQFKWKQYESIVFNVASHQLRWIWCKHMLTVVWMSGSTVKRFVSNRLCYQVWKEAGERFTTLWKTARANIQTVTERFRCSLQVVCRDFYHLTPIISSNDSENLGKSVMMMMTTYCQSLKFFLRQQHLHSQCHKILNTRLDA